MKREKGEQLKSDETSVCRYHFYEVTSIFKNYRERSSKTLLLMSFYRLLFPICFIKLRFWSLLAVHFIKFSMMYF